uniref:Cystatin domain-containing protein n=1 Tax=Sander lucioperca TaxID=283035 RepID=A0A8D0A6F2_SANLU
MFNLPIPGGWSRTTDSTEWIQKICHQVKPQVEKETGLNYGEYTALKYRSQVVQGLNLVIKVNNIVIFEERNVFV